MMPPRIAAGLIAASALCVIEAAEVRLATTRFDPLRDGEPRLAATGPAGPVLRPGPDLYRLVQLDRPITAGIRRALETSGLAIVGHVPERTLIVRLPAADAEPRLAAIAGRRWSGRILPGYKVAPELRRTIDSGVSGPAPAELSAFLFSGEDPASLAAAVARTFDGARAVFESAEEARLDIDLPAASLAAAVDSLARDPAVQYVAPRPVLAPDNDQAVWIGQSYDRDLGPGEALASDPKPYTGSGTVWSHGLNGAGQVIAVADTGLEHGTCFFDDPAVPLIAQNVAPPGALALQPEHRKVIALNAPLASSYATDDPFRHGTHVASSALGDDLTNACGVGQAGHDHGDGMAPAAKLVFEDVSGSVHGDCFTGIVVSSIGNLLEQEYGAGARISTNSWGGGGDASAAISIDTRIRSHEDFLVLFSAGNNGGSSLNAQASCKNCVAVGASETYNSTYSDAFGSLDPENMAAFSSRGPTADGRIKPDVVAPGFRVDSARLPVAYYIDDDDPACDTPGAEVCFPNFGGCYVTDPSGTCDTGELLGTSMATPLTAGLGALARQYFVEGFGGQAHVPSAALLKATLINGARNMTGRLYERRGTPVDLGPLADAPSAVQGWGRVMLDDVLHFAGDTRRLRWFDLANKQGLATGQSVDAQFNVTSAAEPLKLTLGWTDAPGQAMSGNALVNDLDLELTAPDGTVFRGNQWTADALGVAGDRQSQPDPVGRDDINSVEGILIPVPQPGLYALRIVGQDVPGDGSLLTQGAALVTTGDVADCTAAPAPANLRVESFSEISVALAWDEVAGALGYVVYRNATACAAPMPADEVMSVPASTKTLVDGTVAASTIYNYTVRALMSAEGCQTADSTCVSALTVAATAPPPVPDGQRGSPLLVGKGPTTLRLNVFWDATTCPPDGRHLLYGSLGEVATQKVSGAACGLGASGTFQWIGVPAGDLWFLVVGSSAGQIEGDWGERSDGLPRGGGVVSGRCGMLVRDDGGSCGDGD